LQDEIKGKKGHIDICDSLRVMWRSVFRVITSCCHILDDFS